jgi:thioredoxin-related protein
MMAPMVHGLEAKYAGQVDFFFLDADDPATRDLQRQFEFRFQPYFVLLDGSGNEIQRWAGSVSQDEFESAFAEALK